MITGRGEHIRAIWRAFRAAGVSPRVYDLHQQRAPDEIAFQALVPHTVSTLSGGVRIFHLNGDELAPAIEQLECRQPGVFHAGYNIAFPAWELPRYPAEWARQLERFDEIWAASAFVRDSLRAAVSIPIIHLPNACEPHVTAPLQRNYFGLPERAFLILFSFDLFSYHARKNPFAVIETFRRVLAARPSANVHLALKLNHVSHDSSVLPAVRDAIAGFAERVTLLDATLTDNEIKNLVRWCDCFLSLHRSEGFGRGPAEAMFFSKPVVATGWSGNMEYMNDAVSFPVGFDLIPVKAGEYPAWQDQHWADPRIPDAVTALLRLIDTPTLGQAVGERARAHMQRKFSDQVLGRRYRQRLRKIGLLARGLRDAEVRSLR